MSPLKRKTKSSTRTEPAHTAEREMSLVPTSQVAEPLRASLQSSDLVTIPASMDENTGATQLLIKGESKYGITKLYDGGDRSNVDIVFVHGLTGDAYGTWLHEHTNVHWPSELLKQDMQDTRILTFGYDGDFFRVWRLSNSRLGNHAESLVSKLAVLRERSKSETRKILFVAHSFGGLVVERALSYSKNTAEAHLKQVERCTVGIIFLGVPHCGVDINMWSTFGLRLCQLIKPQTSTLLKTLNPGSEMLRDAQQNFHNILRIRSGSPSPIEITCFFEELDIKGIGTLVPQHSAEIKGYELIPIHANHMDRTKFPNQKDDGYITILGQLLRWEKSVRAAVVWTKSNPPTLNIRCSKHFVRREILASQLEALLPYSGQESKASHLFLLHGLGGMGKTQLLLDYYTTHAPTFQMPFWVDASSQGALDRAYETIARNHQKVNDIAEIRTWLSTERSTWMLVLDDVNESLSIDITEYLPTTPTGCLVLVSARSQHLEDFADAGSLAVKSMSTKEAVDLLLQTAGKSTHDEREISKARELVEDLGNIALAIDLAGAYIKKTRTTISNYRTTLIASSTKLPEQLHKKPHTGYKNSIKSTWDISYTEISGLGESARYAVDILHFLVFLHPQKIPVQILTEAWKTLNRIEKRDTKGFSIKVVGEESTEDSLRGSILTTVVLLADYSLIEWEIDIEGQPSYISMQPMVHQWARDRMLENDRRECWNRAVCTMAAALDTSLNDRNFQREVLPHLDHLLGPDLYQDSLFRMPCGFDESYEHVFLFTDVYSDAGSPRKSAKLREFLSDEVKNHLPSEQWNVRYAQLLQQLATNYSDLGEDQNALQTRHAAVTELTRAVPQNSPMLLSCRSDLAGSLHNMDQHEEARRIRTEIWTQIEMSQDDEKYRVLVPKALRNLASSLRICGQRNEATKKLDQCIQFQQANSCEDDHELLVSMTELAKTYEHSGNFSKAEGLYRKVWNLRERYSHKDQDILAAKEDVANITSHLQNFDRAAVLRREILGAWEELQNELGTEHPNLLIARLQLGRSLAEIGGNDHLDQALIELGRVHQIRERRLGSDHPATLTSLLYIGSIYSKRNNPEAAIRKFEQVLEGWERQRTSRLTSEYRHGSSRARNALANTYRDGLKDYAKALSIRKQIFEQQQLQDHDLQDESTLRTMKELITDYHRNDQDEAASEEGEKALYHQRKALGDKHYLVRETSIELHICYLKLRKRWPAVDCLEVAVEIEEANHWWAEASKSVRRLKEIYQGMGQETLAANAQERQDALQLKSDRSE